MHRFILDSDGSNLFSNLPPNVDEGIAETVADCPPEVTTYMLCSAAGTTYYPSKVASMVNNIPSLTAAVARGRDLFGDTLRALRDSGREIFITLRMNDVHNPTEEWNVPRVRKEHPNCVVGADEIIAGKSQWMSYCLDYAKPEVRGYMLDLVAEQLDRYGDLIHGFQLDWMRFPRHLAGNAEQVWAHRDAITNFTVQVRAMMNAKRKLLSARVPVTPECCRFMGMDVAEWTRRGLVDLIVACPFLTTHWDVRTDDFRRWIAPSKVPIYAGVEFHFGRQSHHPESLQGIAACHYHNHADGIYLFNFACWIEYHAARPYHWLHGLDRPGTLKKPMLVAVDHRRHRIEGVDPQAPLPASLAPGASVQLPLLVPALALPARRAIVLIESRGDVALTINGAATPEVRSEQASAGMHRPEIFLEFVDQTWDKNGRPGQEDCRIFRAATSGLVAGVNTLKVTNLTDSPMEIGRVTMGFW